MIDSHLQICVIGAGPRGLSVLERLCANERSSPSGATVTVHVVDPAPPGAGRVWRTDQSRHLLMNTVASQITVYTDDSVRIDGPVEPGPSLYEWAKSLAPEGSPDPAPVPAGTGPGGPGRQPDSPDGAALAEAAALGPNTYPTRAFYGHYLHAAFRAVVAAAPPTVTVRVHRSRAVAMADAHGFPGGPQGVRLEDGTRLNRLDAIVLAQGHLPARPTPREARTASLARIHHLDYITPANPADVHVTARPGQTVLLRGLGLNFFDHMALFTLGRGGRFEQADGGLVYRPSGAEPRLYATSRRGIPYHARGENEKGAYGRHLPRLLTAEVVAELRERTRRGGPVRFATDLWPLVSREVEAVYYGALLAARARGAEREAFTDRFLTADDPAAVLDDHGIPEADRWSWDRLSRPYAGREFTDRADFRDWLLGHLRHDVAEARAGNLSGPLKAALDVLRDLRNEIRMAVDHSGIAGDSYRDDLDGWYTPLNAFLSIGPPVERIEQLIALIEAGVVELLGPGTEIRIDPVDPAFAAHSTAVPGPPVRASVLVEARLPEPDLRRTDDPLLRHLLDTEQCAAYRIPGPSGTGYPTGGLAVTERPYRLLDGRGRAHPRRFAYGVPTESVHWVTAAGIRPGVDSVTLGDSDAIARAVLALSPAPEWPGTAPDPVAAGSVGSGGSAGSVASVGSVGSAEQAASAASAGSTGSGGSAESEPRGVVV
ncbi:FAD/NAD(P)-binding protein [Kitasatospora purpeofusca]|uniref:FAD/NAD(P)-binding protein n=1 Tax=Kitasatospora purpeofusca TaxID=67352 RepID=UPI002A5A7B92|nr:FAD/NAD(P)-binding protein [Kitasatospora purpeofusca]MDY0812926.1 FAD/NAD(P)-binding protein [Kitasatospora purpeofusca]